MNKPTYIKILVGITSLALIFHMLILLKIIPYDITWGGRLRTDQEMYVFEAFSILVNSFFIYILLQKGSYVKNFFSERTITIILWMFFGIFCLNRDFEVGFVAKAEMPIKISTLEVFFPQT
jgi:hypothetical protein